MKLTDSIDCEVILFKCLPVSSYLKFVAFYSFDIEKNALLENGLRFSLLIFKEIKNIHNIVHLYFIIHTIMICSSQTILQFQGIFI
jgi:hypothetical protein